MIDFLTAIGFIVGAVVLIIQQHLIRRLDRETKFIRTVTVKNHASITELRFKAAELAHRTGNPQFSCDKPLEKKADYSHV